ncbi:MAG: Flp pilus assembly protein CpaB [Chloroflexi bacterium]|nr:Flp pilus assembly protein CpaB [Chloroflexota bacterium]
MNRASSLSIGGSSRLGLLLAAALAAVAGVLVYTAVQSADDGGGVSSVTGGDSVFVVTAKRDIPARTEITADMLQLTEVPAKALLAGALGEDRLAVGQVARIPIYRGEQLVQEKLASAGDDTQQLGLPYVVPAGKRGMAVKADKVVGAGGLLRPGDRVDVLGTVEVKYQSLNGGTEFHDTRSFLLAQDVEVLAVEQKLENKALPQGDGSSTTDGTLVDQADPQPDATVVTLAITSEEAQQILLVEVKGTIRLAVRAPGDTAVAETPDSTLLSLADPEFQAALKEALKNAR